MPRWISVAQRTAFTTLPVAAKLAQGEQRALLVGFQEAAAVDHVGRRVWPPADLQRLPDMPFPKPLANGTPRSRPTSSNLTLIAA